MSYCRWSTDNFRCDLYCYADVSGGYTTHVAGRRHGPEYTEMPEFDKTDPHCLDEWYAKSFVDIGLPHDGKSFNDPTLEDFLARVTSLRDMGYIVPDRAIENIKVEIEDEKREHDAIHQN